MNRSPINIKTYYKFTVFLVLLLVFFGGIQKTNAAVLKLSPNNGTFTVGDTFDVSLFLDTEGREINLVKATLSFPSDKLQLVSPAAGNSIIGMWVISPKYDEQKGVAELSGGIFNGIKTSNGLVNKFVFRVKSVGTATIKLGNDSNVLLNDGEGTEALSRADNGIYNLALPPPAGPIVVSKTHPDQARWYSQRAVDLKWVSEDNASGFSYSLDENPNSIPDDIQDENGLNVIYENISEGSHFFHIKALRDGAWGGTTHYAVNIDSTPPADFPVEVLPGERTTERRPVLKFATTDNLSGIDHYEIKTVSLQEKGTISAEEHNNQPFFIEATSPFIPSELAPRDYDIIVRAYDKAGNYSDATRHVKIVVGLYRFITSEGFLIGGYLISWTWPVLLGGVILIILAFIARKIRNKYYNLKKDPEKNKLPKNVLEQLEELKRIKEKYGKLALALVAVISTLIFSGQAALAENAVPEPPLITNISEKIYNDEIFYVGGKTETSGTEIVLYLQNLKTGEIRSANLISDKRGDWFYRHNSFLSGGEYALWAKSKIGEEMSSPSPQMKITVQRNALQLGSLRIGYKTLYLAGIIILLILIIVLLIYIIRKSRHINKRQRIFKKEVAEVEEAIRHGFLTLRRDIEKELALIEKAELKGALSMEEKEVKKRLISDMEKIQGKIKKEMADIEKLG